MPTSVEFSKGARTAFWVISCVGLVVMPMAWVWYGFALAEEESEQGKAINAGTSMEGFAATFGLFPLIALHVISVSLLLYNGWRGWGVRGLVFGAAALVVASVLGFLVAQLIFGTELLEIV